MILTKDYTLQDFLRSQTATRLGFSEQFVPSDEVVANLTALAENIVQPLRDALGSGLVISSGYRCFRLNEAVKGAATSQHVKGQAVDLEYYSNGIMDNRMIEDAVDELKLEVDQILNEHHFSWVHISYNTAGNRNQKLDIA